MKRIITVVLGYAVMAWMVYLIIVTARSTPKIWDPYDILGISRVRGFVPSSEVVDLLHGNLLTVCLLIECQRKSDLETLQAPFSHLPPRQDPT